MDGARRAAGKPIELRLLGPVEASRGTAPLALGGPKPRALLALLALDVGRVVSVDRLVEELWPATPPESAQHAIQVYVSQLRKQLGDAIAREGPGYRLGLDPDDLDIHRFTRLAAEGRDELRGGNAAAATATLHEALALWRGPALADFAYEPFAQTEIARLDDLRFAALEDRIEADLLLGRHAELVSEIEALVEAQPLRERPRALLMRALYLAGRQADALAAYRAARSVFVEELGVEPGPELRELEAAILRQDESLLPDERSPRPAMQFRRLATILFVDVVDSMAMAEALDAEALGVVQRRYFETVSSALTRHGGTVEKYAGDAVMAAFGVPVTHEDDALRAARAALDIRTGVAALSDELEREHGVALEIRIGLAAGEIVAASTASRQRFVAGDAVGVAARLQHEAEPGGIVVGEIVARLLRHAATLESLGTLDVKSRKAPIEMYRLVELTPAAPTFERRLDAPLIGRKRELAALRKALARAKDGGHAQLAVVTGPAGVGKSRLAGELARRARGTSLLWGRCLSYGDGITYWPVREMLAQSTASDERDEMLDALEAETPPPASEIALLFRRFCEASGRKKPLVVVFDDVHWAESTLLDLVEQLAERGEGRILVLCVARDEILEDRPSLVEHEGTELVALEALSRAEAEALLEELGGATLDALQRERLVETAQGNPFFVEQLLALSLEGGLVEQSLPETVQALLAARLDRLGPGERAVLERGSVVGSEFTRDDAVALLDPAAVPTVDAHLRVLAERRFLRPRDGTFAFRHILVQEAVYRAAPKRLRAELHERFAERLDTEYTTLPDLDEFVGYHLEQAHRLRVELGETTRRTEQLAGDAGGRLGAAGFRALKRGDMPATASLLERAVTLLPANGETRWELMCELGIAQHAIGDADSGNSSFAAAVAGAQTAGLRRVELRARLESAYGRLVTQPEGAAENLLAVAEVALPTFETLADERSLARAWLLIGYIRGGLHGNHEAWEAAEERALTYYRRTAFPAGTCLGQIAAALYWGPVPVPAAVAKCQDLLESDGELLTARAAVLVYLGGLHAQAGRFEDAWRLVAEAEHTYEELGATATRFVQCGAVAADVHLLEDRYADAELALREQCAFFDRASDRAHLGVRAAKLAEALYRQDSMDEAEEWLAVARANAASDDVSAQLVLGSVEAKTHARKGALVDAQQRIDEIVRLADTTDGLNQVASTRMALAEVLRATDPDRADEAVEEAVALFERKGNVAGAAQARRLLSLSS